jgi:hypothetical protein
MSIDVRRVSFDVDEKSPSGNARAMTIFISIINKPHLLLFFPMVEMTFVRRRESVLLLLADDASPCQFQLTARLSGNARSLAFISRRDGRDIDLRCHSLRASSSSSHAYAYIELADRLRQGRHADDKDRLRKTKLPTTCG